MKHEFLPAVGPYAVNRTKKEKVRHILHWLDKKVPEVFYPYALASYALWRKTSLPFSRNDVVVFGDSGGYTQVTQPDYSASPTDVLRWQLRFCSRGVMFDIPPYRPGSSIQFSGDASRWWDESVATSVRNVQRALPLYLAERDTNPFRWWGVVQGEEREQLERWYDAISQVYPFNMSGEGWALAPKPSTDLLSCTRYLRFVHDKGIKNVHLLQVTADRTVGLVLALGQMAGSFDLITYDSASALRCAINRNAILPDGFGQRYIKEWDGNNLVLNYMKTCPCQACEWMREWDGPIDNAAYPHYLLLHNHLTLKRSFELIWVEVQRDPERMLRWATGLQYGEVLREWEKELISSKPQRKSVSLLDRL